jgi:uncharacterized DUF497 family protein
MAFPHGDVSDASLHLNAVQLEWDEAKRTANVAKHGIDFVDAPEMFHGPMLIKLDQRKDYGESRWQGLGLVQGRPMVVAYTKRNPDTIRIIH